MSELRAALNKADKELSRRLTKALKEGAKIVATEAKSIAAREGLAPPGRSGRGTGQLVRSIKPFARRTIGGVRVKATRAGFPYPVIYEFGGKGRRGPRPFVTPAVENKADEVAETLDDELGDVLRRAGL